jgi:hypothetical protein
LRSRASISADNLIKKIGYIGGKRYVQATITPTNNTGNVFLAALWILGKNNMRPTPNPPT